MNEPATRLLWEGRSRLEEALALIGRRHPFELELPPDYHFTLFRRLHPDAPQDAPEQVDVTGGAELIGRIAEIRGLESLADLMHPLSNAGARLQVLSPGPSIRVSFPD